MPSQIVRHQLRVVRLPYEFSTRPSTHVVLQVYTDDGIEGFSYNSQVGGTPATIKLYLDTVTALMEQVNGRDPNDVERVNHDLLSRSHALGPMGRRAIGLIDVALWDARGKQLDKPLYQLLGGATDRVRIYAGWELWWQIELDQLAKNVQRFTGMGFTAMKYRVGGMKSVTAAVERTKVMREAAGPDVDLLVDANQSWDVKFALRVIPEMQRQRLFYMEDPISEEDQDGLVELAHAIEPPLACGEAYHSIDPFRTLLERRGLDVVMVDLNVGGLTQWMKIAHMAEAYGRPIVSHLCPEVLSHAVAAVPHGLIVEYLPWFAAALKEPLQPVNGEIVHRPDRPGLGLEIDETAMGKYAFAA
ncbi:MAG TPA: mandelate racemase/muconate lactonizing enzyme family protein [Chloroflexota bacterium]|nr:mandelate racemase/muconate lactonizing enzyme family protein [Chloroflexota bacterium]